MLELAAIELLTDVLPEIDVVADSEEEAVDDMLVL
jgi:hypothetical protein